MTDSTFCKIGALFAVMLFAGAVQASPITFNFTYSGAATPPPMISAGTNPFYPKAVTVVPSTAVITGSVTFESTLLANPGLNNFTLPNPAVLALSVTVSGASAGNGTYGLSNFHGVLFDTGPNALDFSKPLVGQPEGTGTWGPPSYQGDFNLFGIGTAPVGKAPFLLCANGGSGSCASLVSAGVAVTSTPALNLWGLLAMAGLLGLAGFAGMRRYRTSN